MSCLQTVRAVGGEDHPHKSMMEDTIMLTQQKKAPRAEGQTIGQGIDVFSHQAPYKPIVSGKQQEGNTLAIAHEWLEKGYISVPHSKHYYADLLGLYWDGWFALHIPFIKMLPDRAVVLTEPIVDELPGIRDDLERIFSNLHLEYPGYVTDNLSALFLACGSNVEVLAERVVNVFDMLLGEVQT